MSNLIRANNWRTKFCDEPHLVIAVDGVALDELIADATGNPNILGLIPTWLDDLYEASERKVVWDRIQPNTATNVIVPVLMCPDDLDFSCTIIVADTTYDSETVTWRALGMDATTFDRLPDSIGSSVNWYPDVGPFNFSRSDYDDCVAKFRLNLEASGR